MQGFVDMRTPPAPATTPAADSAPTIAASVAEDGSTLMVENGSNAIRSLAGGYLHEPILIEENISGINIVLFDAEHFGLP